MRKQTKIAAMVSAAALLTIGAAMTSFAAGWTMDGEDWVYTDKYGDRVTNEWKKSGNNWYYLGDDGLMVTSTLIRDSGSSGNDTYYVNSGGVKVTNYWIEMPNDDGFTVNDSEPSTVYYYMDNEGKAIRATTDQYKVKQLKKNNNTTEKAYFIFDTEGHMMTGWVDVPTDKANVADGVYRYYLGDDEEGDDAGVARTGWQYLEDPDDAIEDPYEDSHWYWFTDTGKCAEPESSRYIDGKYFHFNSDRQMDSGWFDFASQPIESASMANVGRTKSDGRMETGWVQRTEDEEDDVYWYYLINERGSDNRVVATVPFNRNGAGKGVVWSDDNGDGKRQDGEFENDPCKYAARSINNKIYLFNDKGQMITGLTADLDDWQGGYGAYVYNSNSKVMQDPNNATVDFWLNPSKYYYFTNSGGNAGQMAKNTRVTVNIDGDTYYYHFQKDGSAYTDAVVNGILYAYDGKRVQSDAGWMSYMLPGSGVTYYKSSTETYNLSGEVAINASGHVKTLTIPSKVGDSTTSTVRIDGATYTVTWTLTKAYDKVNKKAGIIVADVD